MTRSRGRTSIMKYQPRDAILARNAKGEICGRKRPLCAVHGAHTTVIWRCSAGFKPLFVTADDWGRARLSGKPPYGGPLP